MENWPHNTHVNEANDQGKNANQFSFIHGDRWNYMQYLGPKAGSPFVDSTKCEWPIAPFVSCEVINFL